MEQHTDGGGAVPFLAGARTSLRFGSRRRSVWRRRRRVRLCRSGVGGRGSRGGIREEKRVLPYFVVRPTVSFDRHASVRTLLRIPFFCKGILSRTQLWDHIYIFLHSSRERVNRLRVELRSSNFLPPGRKTAYFMCFRGSPF